MVLIFVLTGFVAICKCAIAISKKLSAPTWKLLSHVQFLLFIVCIIGLQSDFVRNPQPKEPQTFRTHAQTAGIYPDLSTPTIPYDFGHVAVVTQYNSSAPLITNISPTVKPNGSQQPISVLGNNYQSDTTVFLIDSSGTTRYCASYLHLYWPSSEGFGFNSSNDHLHLLLRQSDFPSFPDIPTNPPTVVIRMPSDTPAGVFQEILRWAQLLGAIMLPFGILSTNILAWVVYHNARVEARIKEAEQRLQLEKLKLEVQKLAFEVAKAQRESEHQQIILQP